MEKGVHEKDGLHPGFAAEFTAYFHILVREVSGPDAEIEFIASEVDRIGPVSDGKAEFFEVAGRASISGFLIFSSVLFM
jgi:hypothetical protein